jgi:hypothetical protein
MSVTVKDAGDADMKSKSLAALVAAAGLIWGTAHAAPDTTEALPEAPNAIVIELQPIPGVEPGSEQEQAILGMIVQQLLDAMQSQGAMQAQDGSMEVQFVPPPQGQEI